MIAGLNVCLLTALPEVISFICAAVGEPLWHKAASPYQPSGVPASPSCYTQASEGKGSLFRDVY